MKTITMKEFAIMTKEDEVLRNRIMSIQTKGQEAKNDLTKLAAEYGYELITEPEPEIVELEDDQVADVAGGGGILDIDAICKTIFDWFGFDSKNCVED